MSTVGHSPQSLAGHLLVAMPGMPDPRFAHSVIYMCAHSPDGAMGLVINQALPSLKFPDLLRQLEIEATATNERIQVHFGGPVESARGFVLHSDDYRKESTLVVDGGIALTATLDILKAIARGDGPHDCLFALGYAGWGPGQLDSEILANGWLHVEADQELVFRTQTAEKWTGALRKLHVDPLLLSDDAGHA